MSDIPELDLASATVLLDPFGAHTRARQEGAVVRAKAPGIGTLWTVLRHTEARAMLSDPRFCVTSGSFLRPPGIPDHCQKYLRTMAELDGPEHARLRRLVSPAFTARRALAFRGRIEAVVYRLLDELPNEDVVDLVEHFARPLPIEVICEWLDLAPEERPLWRSFGTTVAAGAGPAFAAAIPDMLAAAERAVAARRAQPGDDLISTLIGIQEADGERLTDDELVAHVWHLLLAGQTPANLIANGIEVLLTHEDQLSLLLDDLSLMPRAVEELLRYASPQLLTVLRYPSEDVKLGDTVLPKGEPVSASMAAANRDPAAFDEPDRFDILRTPTRGHLAFGHGPHFCLGASLARVETGVALTGLLRRFPNLALGGEPRRAPDGGTWRLAELPVRL